MDLSTLDCSHPVIALQGAETLHTLWMLAIGEQVSDHVPPGDPILPQIQSDIYEDLSENVRL